MSSRPGLWLDCPLKCCSVPANRARLCSLESAGRPVGMQLRSPEEPKRRVTQPQNTHISCSPSSGRINLKIVYILFFIVNATWWHILYNLHNFKVFFFFPEWISLNHTSKHIHFKLLGSGSKLPVSCTNNLRVSNWIVRSGVICIQITTTTVQLFQKDIFIPSK